MDTKWNELDIPTLRSLYEAESGRLKTALINGAAWDDTFELRQRVTDLAIALHRKRFYTTRHPAANDSRSRE